MRVNASRFRTCCSIVTKRDVSQETPKKKKRWQATWPTFVIVTAWSLSSRADVEGLALEAQQELRTRLETMPKEQARGILQQMTVEELMEIYHATRNPSLQMEHETQGQKEDWTRDLEREWQRDVEVPEGGDTERSRERSNTSDSPEALTPDIRIKPNSKLVLQRLESTVPLVGIVFIVATAAFVVLKEGSDTLGRLMMGTGLKAPQEKVQKAHATLDSIAQRAEEATEGSTSPALTRVDQTKEVQEEIFRQEGVLSSLDVPPNRSDSNDRILWSRREDVEESSLPGESSEWFHTQQPLSRKQLRKSLDIRSVPQEKVRSVLQRALDGELQAENAGNISNKKDGMKEDPWKTVFGKKNP